MAGLRKSERHFQQGPRLFYHKPAAANGRSYQISLTGSGLPGLEHLFLVQWTRVTDSDQIVQRGFEPRPISPLVYESVALTTRPHALVRKGSIGHAFTICIHTENQNQVSFYIIFLCFTYRKGIFQQKTRVSERLLSKIAACLKI